MEDSIFEIIQLINQSTAALRDSVDAHIMRLDGRIDGLYTTIIGGVLVVILSNIGISKYNNWQENKRTKEYLLKYEVGANGLYLGKNSPVVLNKDGEEKVEVLGIKVYVDNNIDKLAKKFNLRDEPVDIYERAKEVSVTVFTNEKMLKSKEVLDIRNKAYNDGIDLPAVVSMFSVYLRDKVLEKKEKRSTA